MNENPAYKSGFATLIGRPNVGKSTLMNRLFSDTKLSAIVLAVPVSVCAFW